MKNSTRRVFIQRSCLASASMLLPFSLTSFTKFNSMADGKNYEVIYNWRELRRTFRCNGTRTLVEKCFNN